MEEQTIVNGVTSPRLTELKTRQCTQDELQAALVHLIDMFNEQGELMQAAINRKQDKQWRANI